MAASDLDTFSGNTEVAYWQSIKAKATKRLNEILANPKPTYSVGGESYSWESYQRMLSDMVEKANAMLPLADDGTGVGSAWMVTKFSRPV